MIQTFDIIGLNKEGTSSRTEKIDYLLICKLDSGENFKCFFVFLVNFGSVFMLSDHVHMLVLSILSYFHEYIAYLLMLTIT